MIDGCRAKDPIAWEQFCAIVDSASRYWIRHLLTAHRLDATRDDDILQELYRQLWARRCRPLNFFRGRTFGELRAFLRRVAYRFAKKLVGKWERLRRKEEAAIRLAGAPERRGPSEPDIASARNELLRIMSITDQQKVILISGEDGFHAHTSLPWLAASKVVTSRTLRRWRKELLSKYANRI